VHFREHRPENLLTKSVSVNWNEKAVCPIFKEALAFWTNEDRDLQRTIQQLLGISCTGDTSIQSFILLYGPGASGKSTLIEIVREILADYAITLPSETLLLRRYGKEEERKLATLPGARFATASETESGGVMDENLMKLLTGEDTVAGRRLYEESFNFKPEIKIWLRTNNRPEIRGTGNDVWRRIITLPFGQEVPEGKKDPHLKDKLRLELEGIFTWMVRGYVDYVQNGLFLAPVVMKAKEQYRKEQNVIERFFEERCEFDPEYSEHRVNLQYSIGRDELYAGFAQWCRDNGVRIIPPVKMFKTDIKEHFKERMREQKVSVHKKQEMRWLGVNTKVNLFSGAKY
jgi:putative DNA primase/helicase